MHIVKPEPRDYLSAIYAIHGREVIGASVGLSLVIYSMVTDSDSLYGIAILLLILVHFSLSWRYNPMERIKTKATVLAARRKATLITH